MTSSIITIYNVDDPFLKLDCFNDETNRLICSIPLFQMYGSEINFNQGRFKKFSSDMPPNKVFLRVDSNSEMPLTERFRIILIWINDVNKKNLWSFSGRVLEYKNQFYRIEFIFGFEDVAVSFAFAMAFI
jgi:hypothetical protein